MGGGGHSLADAVCVSIVSACGGLARSTKRTTMTDPVGFRSGSPPQGPGEGGPGSEPVFVLTRRVLRRVILTVLAILAIAGTGIGAFVAGRSDHPNQAAAAHSSSVRRHQASVPSTSTSVARPTTTLPSTTSPPSTTISAPSPALPGIPPCAAGPTSPVIRPTTVYLSCGDGSVSVTSITWQSWGTAAAYGTGTLNVNTCQPDCAAGNVDSYPASIEVSNPSSSSGVPIFQDVTVTPTGGAGQVQSSQTPGGWGAG